MTACTCNSFSSSTGTPALAVSQTGTAIGLTLSSTCSTQNAMTISTNTNNSSGLWSNCTGYGTAIAGSNNCSNGLGIGVWGSDGSTVSTSGGVGVLGSTTYGTGVKGTATDANGNAGAFINSGSNVGYGAAVLASSNTAYAIWANGQTVMNGSLDIYDTLLVNGTATFNGYISKPGGGYLIDHPTDPQNLFLNHCFVESPEMLNIYRGVATLDASGNATVQLPSYFSAANQNAMPILTAIGASMTGLYASDVVNGTFSITGGITNGRVCWMITAARADKWAVANHPGVEIAKTAEQKGKYLHPELFGATNKDLIHAIKKSPNQSSKPKGA